MNEKYLTVSQMQAISYLLEGVSLEEIANRLNKSPQNIYDWWHKDPLFFDTYTLLKSQIVESTINYLLTAHNEVVDTLLSTMKDSKTSIKDRTKCAEVLLNAILKTRGDDIENRLSRLEQGIENNQIRA
jgi:predicted DNA-binding protein YlxM (UPF0122 family)